MTMFKKYVLPRSYVIENKSWNTNKNELKLWLARTLEVKKLIISILWC